MFWIKRLSGNLFLLQKHGDSEYDQCYSMNNIKARIVSFNTILLIQFMTDYNVNKPMHNDSIRNNNYSDVRVLCSTPQTCLANV